MKTVIVSLVLLSLVLPAQANEPWAYRLAKNDTSPPSLKLEDLGLTNSQASEDQNRIEGQLKQRHSQLELHETMALVTWGLMATTVLFAEKAKTSNVHQYLGAATAATYFTTAYLSMTAPDPLNVSGKTGLNIKIHKTLRWVHLPLMALIPFAGIQANRQVKRGQDPSGLGQYKGAIGGAAFAAYTVAGAVMLFEF